MTDIRPIRVRVDQSDDLKQSGVEYTAALVAGDAEAAHRVIDEVLSKPCSLGKIYTQVVAPSLVSIGDLWCRGDITVAEEHLASQIVLGHLDRLNVMFAWRERRVSYVVLVACVEGERHSIGARMFADLCLSHGWSADFLGADVPDGALIEWVQKRRPQLVALSATMAGGAEHARHLVEQLSVLANAPRILLGGSAMSQEVIKKSSAGGVEFARDLLDGVDIAQKFLRANRPKVILKEYLSALGRRVRDLRLKKGWTQEQLAEAARVTRVCIVAVEGGKQNVSMDIVIRLANALSVTPENLLAGDSESFQILRRNG